MVLHYVTFNQTTQQKEISKQGIKNIFHKIKNAKHFLTADREKRQKNYNMMHFELHQLTGLPVVRNDKVNLFQNNDYHIQNYVKFLSKV